MANNKTNMPAKHIKDISFGSKIPFEHDEVSSTILNFIQQNTTLITIPDMMKQENNKYDYFLIFA